MGTTAEKGAYIIETKSLLKDKINNLGGSIDDNTTFRQYANQLQNVYDNLPRTSYQEGTEVNLGVTSKGKLDYENGVVGIGQTEQDSTTGKNLLNYIDNLRTDYGGLTSIINADGSITTTGIPATDYVTIVSIDITNMLENGQRYYISQKTQQTNLLYLQVNIKDNETSAMSYCSLNTGTSNSFVADTTNKTYRMNLQTGTISSWGASSRTITNTYQLEKGNSATSFEQYTGGQASPNPSYPQDIEVVRGKNILNPELLNVFAQDKYISTLNYNSKGTIKVKPLSTYTISFDRFAGDGRIYEYDENDTLQNTINLYPSATPKYLTFTTTANTKRIGFYAAIDTNGGVTIENAKPMLCEGAEHRAYLPYNTIEEIVRGKNIFDGELELGTYNSDTGAKDNASSNYRNKNFIKVKPDTTYTTSINGVSQRYCVYYYNSSKTLISWTSQLTTGTFTTPPNTEYVNFRCFITDFTSDFANLKVQMEQGSTATTYEPYITPTSYQLSLGDIELNAIGNYKDELIYDVDEDKVYKNEKIGKKIFTGASGESWSLNSINQYGIANFLNTSLTDYNITTGDSKGLCNYFEPQTSVIAQTTTSGFLINNQKYLYVRIESSIVSTVEAFKTWLSTHNTEVCYPLATPVETEITDTTLINQVKALYNAHSNNGTTIITSNGNLPMIIKVRALKGE